MKQPVFGLNSGLPSLVQVESTLVSLLLEWGHVPWLCVPNSLRSRPQRSEDGSYGVRESETILGPRLIPQLAHMFSSLTQDVPFAPFAMFLVS